MNGKFADGTKRGRKVSFGEDIRRPKDNDNMSG